MNITEPFRRLARLVPDQPAIIRADGSVISYRALDSAIDAMGRHASRFGIGAGDTVQVRVIGPDESLGLILLLAMARLGAVTTDAPVPGRRTRLTFHAGPGAPPATVTVDAGWMAGPPADPAASPPMPMDGAAVLRIFASSGSTGLPKQIVITHGQMTQRVLLRWLSQGGGPTTRIIGINPGGSWGLSVALASLWARGTVVLSNPADAPAAIARHHVDSLILTPASLRTMLDAMPPDLGPFPSLRAVEVGGSLLPPALLHLARERLTPHIQSAMGATEVGAFVTAPAIDLADRPGAVGLIWPGVEVQALDPDGQALPAGTAGVLRVRSPGNASGYAAADAAREDWFKDGWFYSSDIGTVWPDGMLTLSGRTTDVINAGGVKVHPHVIEATLLKLPTVLDAAAFGVPDATGLTQVHAAIVARTQIEMAVLRDFCRVALGASAPVGIVQMKALPRNENGKIMRERLVDLTLHLMRQAAGETSSPR